MTEPLISSGTRGPVRVRSSAEFAKLIGVSLATLRRAIKSGDGPPVVEISSRRLGIRDDDGARWLDSRRRGGKRVEVDDRRDTRPAPQPENAVA